MALDFSEILVTGGAGFIGSHIVDRLLDDGVRVRVLDNLSTGEKKNLVQHQNKRFFRFIEGDIRNFDLVKKAVKGVDAVIHEAALVSVTRSVEDPLLSNEINVTGTLYLLKACVEAHVKRFIFASSCAVYGDSAVLPSHEKLLPVPLSPYAADKVAVENYANAFYRIYDLETVGLRYFNVYGPRQKCGPYSGVISIFINRLLKNEPLMVYGDGEQTRDFINVKDVVEANILSLSKPEAAGKVVNVGTGKQTVLNELAVTIQRLMGKTDLDVLHAEARAGDIHDSYGNITEAKEILGFEPVIQLEDGLDELINWYSKQ